MKRIQSRCGVLPVAALLVAGMVPVALPTVLEAQPPAAGELAIATVYSGGVDFLPNVRYGRAILTISGGGKVVSRELEAHDRLSIGTFDPEGQLLPDGVYKWELELVPDASTARELREAAALHGGTAPEAWRPQSGVFTIRNGLIATPDLVEAGTAARLAAESRSQIGRGIQSSGSFGRAAAEDDDAAVGSRVGVEEEMRAASGQIEVAVAPGGLQPAQRHSERSDATALAIGRSLEPALAPITLQPTQAAGWSGQRPRSDGTNGRDRSQKDQ